MIDLMLSSLAPHICSGCSEYGSILCESCKENIKSENFGACVWCLKPTTDDHQCMACRARYRIMGAWTAGERSEVLKRLLNDYKFESRRAAAGALGELLAATIPELPASTFVTWVPTAHVHIRQRGFDHARLLAQDLARRRTWSAMHLLQRSGSVSQHELGRKARQDAARDTFAPRRRRDFAGTSILLVDDVLTTGETLRACARILQEQGAEVYVAVVARQPLDG